jgi:hypothetical protein
MVPFVRIDKRLAPRPVDQSLLVQIAFFSMLLMLVCQPARSQTLPTTGTDTWAASGAISYFTN